MIKVISESILDIDADIIVMSANPSLLAGLNAIGATT